MAEKIQSINLLPQQGESFLNQFLNWALTIGRLLVILTEIVALGTFLYRFSLDMQIVDLHDKIKSESFIVANFQSAETTFRDLQGRLKTAKQYTAIDGTITGIFSDLTKMGKGKITFIDLTVATQSVKIVLQSPSPNELALFTDALKNDPSITSVSVDKVDINPASAEITVTLTAALKPVAFAQDQQTANPNSSTNQAILNNQ